MRYPGKFVFLLLLCLLCLDTHAHADGFKPGDLLVCVGNVVGGDSNGPVDKIFEFAGTGLRQTLSVPLPLSGTEGAHNLSVDYRGRLQVYNGMFHPSLATYAPGAGWSQQTYDGWTSQGGVDFGGVAAYKNYVFASDMYSAYGGEPNGLVRFNMADGTAVRFAAGTDFETVQMGYDGQLYAVSKGISNTIVSVFNPDDMTLIRTIAAPYDTNGDDCHCISVNQNGELFLLGDGGTIFHCDSNGNVLKTLNIPHRQTSSLALSSDGRIAVGRMDGYVILTDESLNSFSTFQVYSAYNQIAWAVYVTFVPYRAAPLDFNGDGKSDLLWQNQQTGDVVYWLMDGTNRVAFDYLARGIPLEWKIVGTPDLNGDNKPDLVWQSQQTGDIVYWLMDGTNRVAFDYLTRSIPLEWKIVGTPDLNGDGKPDLVWQSQQTGDIVYWLMDGTNRVAFDYLTRGIPLEWKISASH